MPAGSVHWGTSSWSEKSWVGSFYPAGMPRADFLPYYATRFDTVEADNTYYAVPERRLVEGWARRLPEGFRFAAKFPRSVVHCGEGTRPDPERVLVRAAVWDEAQLFLERMSVLGAKLGPLLLQFPWFRRDVFPTPEPFLARLDAFLESLPADFRYAVEVRNRDWIDDELLTLLRRHRTAFVWVELKNMPHPAKLARRLDPWTTDFAYARLIGDRRGVEKLTKTFDRIVVDREPELRAWTPLLRASRERVPDTYVYANNHYAGHGPATIRRLSDLVADGEE